MKMDRYVPFHDYVSGQCEWTIKLELTPNILYFKKSFQFLYFYCSTLFLAFCMTPGGWDLMKKLLICLSILIFMQSCEKTVTNLQPSSKEDEKIVVDTNVPRYIKTDSLLIKGKATDYDSIFCDCNMGVFKDVVLDLGFFQVKLPLMKNVKNILLIYAKDQFAHFSDTTRIETTHSTRSFIRIFPDIPRYSNNELLSIWGYATNFEEVYCETGGDRIISNVKDDRFLMDISLKQNEKNNLMFYALDSLGFSSDTLRSIVIHDNIPPRITESNLPDNGISFNIHSNLVINFDNPIIPNICRLSVGNSYGQVLNPSIEDNSKTLEMEYGYFSVAGNWELSISVYDSAYNVLDSTLTISAFYKKIKYENNLSSAVYSEINNQLYVFFVGNPMLYIYACDSWNLVKQIQLSYPVSAAAINPYNNYLYMTSARSGKITVLDVDNEKEVEFLIPKSLNEPTTDSQLGRIAFAKNGVGLVKTHGSAIQLIDSRNNNEMFFHPDYNVVPGYAPLPYAYNRNENIVVIGMQTTYGSLFSYDYADNEFSQILSDFEFSYGNYFVGDYNSATMVVHDPDGGYMVKPDMSLLGPINFSAPYSFTYYGNESMRLYYVDGIHDQFGIVDFQTQEIIQRERLAQGDYSSFFVTATGDYLILIDNNHEEIFVVEPKTFR